MVSDKDYNAESIKVLEGLEGVRKRFDIIELSRRIKRKGDILILSKLLKIKPRILNPIIGFRDNKYYYLRFNQEDTKKLIEIIKPFIPEFMKYKIGEGK